MCSARTKPTAFSGVCAGDGKYHYHACLLAKPYTGYLLYSFHVKPDTYEVGVIYVHSPELRKLGIKELHLVKAIKIKR